jgi:hypothetical protein
MQRFNHALWKRCCVHRLKFWIPQYPGLKPWAKAICPFRANDARVGRRAQTRGLEALLVVRELLFVKLLSCWAQAKHLMGSIRDPSLRSGWQACIFLLTKRHWNVILNRYALCCVNILFKNITPSCCIVHINGLILQCYWCPLGLKREPGENPGLSPQL